jgi:DNA-binding SARP family transcriptional activator
VEVISEDGRLALSSKQRTLLAALAISANRVVSLDRLFEALWGEELPPSAIKALRSHMSRLRQALAAASPDDHGTPRIETHPGGYVLLAGDDDLDVAVVERCARKGRQALAMGDSVAAGATLAEALSLWRGNSFGEMAERSFAIAEATRLDAWRLALLEERLEADLAAGRHAAVATELDGLCALHPLREGLWTKRMIALYRDGRQVEALRVYQQLRAYLIDELGIEPGPEIKDIEQAILAQDPSLLAGPPPPDATPLSPAGPVSRAAPAGATDADGVVAPTDVAVRLPLPRPLTRPSGTVFLGRDAELDRLLGAFEAAVGGERQGVLVMGEAGIGKTSLAGELAATAHRRGATVLYGRCDEHLGDPYEPFATALSAYVAACPVEVLDEHVRDYGLYVARLVPGLARRLGLPVPRSGPETERHPLFEAVTGLFGVMAAAAPVMLVIDDLHWAHRPTLALLRHLLRSDDPASLLVVVTCREVEPGRAEDLADALADLRRIEGVQRVQLGGLDEGAVTDLLRLGAGRGLGAQASAVARVLAAETAGNPFFVREILRNLEETGRIHHLATEGGPRSDSGDLTDLGFPEGLPEGIRDVISRRLGRLQPATREFLSTAAVVGQDFDAAVVADAGNLTEEQLLAGIDEALAANLIVDLHRPPDRYSFTHALVRQVLYGQLSTSRRLRLHRAVGLALERYQELLRPIQINELAHHFWEAAPLGEAVRAANYAEAAGDEADAQLAYEASARFYRQGLAALDLDPRTDPVARIKLLLKAGAAYTKAGEVPEGKQALLDAAAQARELGRADLLADAALAYGGLVPQAAVVEDPAVVELLEEALQALGDKDVPARAIAAGRLAQWLYHADEGERREHLCQEALAVAGRVGDRATLAEVLTATFWARYGPDDLDGRLRTATAIAGIGEELGDRELMLRGAQCRIHSLLEMGDMDQTSEAADIQARLARELRQPQYTRLATIHSALMAGLLGSFDEAERLANLALTLTQSRGRMEAVRVYGAQMFWLRWLQGRLAEQAELVSKVVARQPSVHVFRAALAWAYAETGNFDGARAALDQLESQAGADFSGLQRELQWWATVVGIVFAVDRLKDTKRAMPLYELLLPYGDRTCTLGQAALYGSAAYYLGLLAGVLDRPDDAVAHFTDATARHEAMGSPPLLALAQSALAGALEDRGRAGDAAEARRLRGQATIVAKTLGMGSIERRAFSDGAGSRG